MTHRYLSIEAPDNAATVDFLSHHVAVIVYVKDGVLSVRVMASTSNMTWEDHEFDVTLPEYTDNNAEEDE